MSSVKDRLKKKLNQKKTLKEEKLQTTVLPLKPKSHVVIKPNDGFSSLKNDGLIIQNTYRVNKIISMVQSQVEKMQKLTSSQIQYGRSNLTVAVPQIWVDNYIDSCTQICYSDKPEFTNSRIIDYFDYKIIALDIPSTPFQNRLDLLTLIWFRILISQNKTVANDIIISMSSLRYFINYIIGLEFYYILSQNAWIKENYPNLQEHEVSVLSMDFGEFRLVDLNNVKRYDEDNLIIYNDWKQIPNPFRF